MKVDVSQNLKCPDISIVIFLGARRRQDSRVLDDGQGNVHRWGAYLNFNHP